MKHLRKKIFEEGYSAFWAGGDCPYDVSSDECGYWIDGWNAAWQVTQYALKYK